MDPVIFHICGNLARGTILIVCRRLIKLERKEGATWNYFHHSNTFMGTTYSDDCDTTSYAMCTLDDIPQHEKEEAMAMILDNLSPDNLPLVSPSQFIFDIIF